MRMTMTALLLGWTTMACTAAEGPEPGPGGVSQVIATQLGTLGSVGAVDEALEHQLFQLDGASLDDDVTWESCDQVRNRIGSICTEIEGLGEGQSCSGQASFFYANHVPRCALRLQVHGQGASPLLPTYLVDFSGASPVQSAPTCGNGVLDDAEECDDGNLDLWDGCDQNCLTEPFNGCEAVIEDYYAQSGIATVRAVDWKGPRSHLMVNQNAVAQREVTVQTCNAAMATADDVCLALQTDMPFVSWCWAQGEFHQDESGPACSVRLNVQFSRLDPGFGVYTTGLQGMLAFTIR